jgi:hypothetical protein
VFLVPSQTFKLLRSTSWRSRLRLRLRSGEQLPLIGEALTLVADADSEQPCALLRSANFSRTALRHNFGAGWLVLQSWRTS